MGGARHGSERRCEPRGHVHTHHTVVLCTAGEGQLEIGAAYRIAAGDVFLVPAGTPHAVRWGEGLALWGVGFCGACLTQQGLGALLAPFERVRAGAAAVLRVEAERRARLEWLLRTLGEEVGAGQPHTDVVQRGALGILLAEVARAGPLEVVQPGGSSLVAAALAYIERHCLEPISLSDVAAALSRSPSHLTALVRAATGRTVQAWIIAGRMAEARRRLEQTDERVDIVAERVSYSDVTHFIRLFRRHHGMTPAAWRRHHQAHQLK